MTAGQRFRVGAYVDDVTCPCWLTVETGGVSLRVGGPWAWLQRGPVVIEHRDRPLIFVTARFAVPWQRCALLVFDQEHRAMVLLSRRKGAEVLSALEAANEVQHRVIPHLGRASSLLPLQQYRSGVRRGRKSRQRR